MMKHLSACSYHITDVMMQWYHLPHGNHICRGSSCRKCQLFGQLGRTGGSRDNPQSFLRQPSNVWIRVSFQWKICIFPGHTGPWYQPTPHRSFLSLACLFNRTKNTIIRQQLLHAFIKHATKILHCTTLCYIKSNNLFPKQWHDTGPVWIWQLSWHGHLYRTTDI